MPEAHSDMPSGAANDTWRTWLMTGVRRDRVDRRRMRGANKGLKKMLLEGMHNGADRPRAWNDFSGAMVRHAVDEAIRALPNADEQVVKLAYFGGCSNREVASRVGMTEATVQRRLRRALATISEHIQNGRTQARRAIYALTIWLSGRWLQDSAHHVVQAAVVASAAVIIVAQPPATAGASRAQPAQSPAKVTPAVPLIPSPAVPALPGRAPVVDVPVTVPVTVPALPSPVTVKLPAV